MKLLEGKIALITGASRGIGKTIAEKFAEQDAAVAFTYQSSEESALSLQNKLCAKGVKAKAYKSDAASFQAADELVKKIQEDFGKIDVVVNNAGITRDNLLLRMTEQQWDEVIGTNLKSVFNVTKAVSRQMLSQRSGSIINLTSVSGVRGNAGQANYAASKGGIVAFSKSVALELGSRNIRCNAIAPGYIETEMTVNLDPKVIQMYHDSIPMKRGGSTTDVANLALFLASDMSTYITGQVIHVNGGMLM